jgi:tight adherence protein C
VTSALLFAVAATAIAALVGNMVRPAPPSLSALIDGPRVVADREDDADLIDQLGAFVASFPMVETLRRDAPSADLAVARRSFEQLLGLKIGLCLAMMLSAPLSTGVAGLLGLRPPPSAPVIAALLLGIAGFFAPDYALAGEAKAERDRIRAATAAFTRIAVSEMRAGEGPASATLDAALHIDGWFGFELTSTLREASLNTVPPWEAIVALGERLGVAELRDVGATVRQAGVDGAAVSRSLEAAADSLRERAMAERKAHAARVNAKLVSREVGVAFCVVALVLAPLVAGLRP